MIDLSIQIVNYKTKKYLIDCLGDLLLDLEPSNLTYQISVLDNNSGDDLADLERIYQAGVSFYYSDKNLGFGAGHNLLAKKSSSKYILILNPDIRIIEPNTVERLIQTMKIDSRVKVVGPKLITAKNKPQVWDHGDFIPFDNLLQIKSRISTWGNRNSKTEVAWISGAVFLIEKVIFDRVKGFDETFFLYSEELDLCLRARRLGAVIVYEPSIKMLHYGSVVANINDHILKSTDIFVKKHFKSKLIHKLSHASFKSYLLLQSLKKFQAKKNSDL